MKTSIITLAIIILTGFNNITRPSNYTGFTPEGTWQGILKISSVELRIVFNVSKDTAGNYTSTLDSPDQSAYGIPVDETIIKGDSIKFIINSVQGFYDGVMIEDTMMIAGTWHQGGMNLELNLFKIDVVEKPKRPQEPKEPFPYKSEEVNFINSEAGDTLAGTLTLPEGDGPFTALILITGSGPQDRNEELLSHKPFLVLSDYLTRNEIAVLRYDDRGIGKSTGEFRKATSEDFAKDGLAAVEYLKTRTEINKIGVGGHSEGGLIAPMVAVQSEDVDFIVMIAGTGIRGDSILMLQSKLIMQANGDDEEKISQDQMIYRQIYNELLSGKDDEQIKQALIKILDEAYDSLSEQEKKESGTKDIFIESQLKVMLSSWFKFFVTYDPYPTLTKVKCPVLAINGGKDLQVPPEENVNAIQSALKEGGNQNFKTIELPGLNHLFQHTESGSPLEYGKIEETFSEDAMKVIADWINENIKN